MLAERCFQLGNHERAYGRIGLLHAVLRAYNSVERGKVRIPVRLLREGGILDKRYSVVTVDVWHFDNWIPSVYIYGGTSLAECLYEIFNGLEYDGKLKVTWLDDDAKPMTGFVYY